MIEETYGHLAHDAEEWELDCLEAFDRRSFGRVMDAVESDENR